MKSGSKVNTNLIRVSLTSGKANLILPSAGATAAEAIIVNKETDRMVGFNILPFILTPF
jgi:hypothetical protein